MHKSFHDLDEDAERSFALQATRLPEAEDALYKTIAILNPGAEATFAPQHSKA